MAEGKKQLLITIGAALGAGFSSTMATVNNKMRGLGSAIRDLEKQSGVGSRAIEKLKKSYNSLIGSQNRQQAILNKRAGFKSQIGDALALTAALATPIKSAMEFESKMADVRKVVDFKEPDGLKKLSQELLKLSRTIPVSVNGLAEIAAAGGQLGVGEDKLLSFVETAAKMSTAFDMTTSEAGDVMAKLSNSYKIPLENISLIGDAINHVSDNEAAKAREIIGTLTRTSGAAQALGLSAQNIIALTGSLIALGQAPAEAGTAVNSVLNKLSSLKESEKGSTAAERAFRKIGLSVGMFKKMLDKDAQGALMTFLKNAGKLKGTARLGVLTDIIGRNFAPTVATLVESLDTYKRQLDLVSDPSKYKGSMEKEFKNRSKTTENAIQLLKNALSELSISIGNILLPSVNTLTKALTSLVQKFADLKEEYPLLTGGAVKIIAGFMGLKLASLVFGYGLTFLAGAVNKIIIVFKALRVAISFLNAATRGFFWPIALITTAYAVYKNWDAVKAFFLEIWEPIEPYWNEFIDLMDELGVTDIITDAWDAAADFFQDIWDDVTIKWDAFIELMEELGVTQFIIDAWEGLKKTFNTLWDAAKPYWESFIDLINRINVADVLITAWEGLKTTFETLWNVATPYWKSFVALVDRLDIANKIKAGWELLKATFETLWDTAKPYWESFVNLVSELDVADKIKTTCQGLKDAFNTLWDTTKTKWDDFLKIVDKLEITDNISKAWEGVKNTLVGLWDGAKAAYQSFKDAITSSDLETTITNIWNGIKNAITSVITAITDVWNTLKKSITSLFSGDSFVGKTFSKVTSWFSGDEKKDTKLLSDKEATVLKQNVSNSGNRQQINNFYITINGIKTDTADTLARKVVNDVASYNKAFLFDKAEEVA